MPLGALGREGQTLCLFRDDPVADTWGIQAPQDSTRNGGEEGEMRSEDNVYFQSEARLAVGLVWECVVGDRRCI